MILYVLKNNDWCIYDISQWLIHLYLDFDRSLRNDNNT